MERQHTPTVAAVSTLRAAAAAAVVAVAQPAPAQEAGAPAVTVRVASADDLRDGWLYVARLAGRGDAARDWDRMMAAVTAGRGLAGIDPRRPAGGYGWIGPRGDDGAVVALLPITGERAFVDLVASAAHAVPEVGGDGVYAAGALDLPGLGAAPLYFRMLRGWAFVTVRDRGALADGRLLAPEAVLSAPRCADVASVVSGGGAVPLPETVASGGPAAGSQIPGNPVAANPPPRRLAARGCEAPVPGMVSMTVNLDRVPGTFKEMVLGQLEGSLGEVRRQPPAFDSPGLWPFVTGMVDELARVMATQLFEGADTALQVDLDRRRGQVALTVTIAGRPGTAMAAAIADFSQATSATAGLLRRDAAFAATMNVVMLKRERELVAALVDGMRQRAVASSGNPLQRIAVATAFDVVKPTLAAGEIDWTVDVLGPGSDGLYNLVGAVKVRDGAALQRVFRVAPAIDPVTDVRYVGTANGSAVHRLTLNAGDGFSRTFGASTAYVAFRDDAVVVAAGPRASNLVREALPAAVTSPRIAEIRIAADRVAPLAADPEVEDVARDVFGDARREERREEHRDDRRDTTVRLSVVGGPALRLRLVVPATVIEFAGAIGHVQ